MLLPSAGSHVRLQLCNCMTSPSLVKEHKEHSCCLLAPLLLLLLQGAGSQVRILLCECLGSPSATMRQLACLTLWSWMGQHASSGNPGTTGNPATTPAHSGVPVSQDPTTISQALWADAELSAALQAQLAAASPCQPLLPGCTAPYMEARPHYVQLRREVLSLVAACMQVGRKACRRVLILHGVAGAAPAHAQTGRRTFK